MSGGSANPHQQARPDGFELPDPAAPSPNQVTTKPRQVPGHGGDQFFDPTATGDAQGAGEQDPSVLENQKVQPPTATLRRLDPSLSTESARQTMEQIVRLAWPRNPAMMDRNLYNVPNGPLMRQFNPAGMFDAREQDVRRRREDLNLPHNRPGDTEPRTDTPPEEPDRPEDGNKRDLTDDERLRQMDEALPKPKHPVFYTQDASEVERAKREKWERKHTDPDLPMDRPEPKPQTLGRKR